MTTADSYLPARRYSGRACCCPSLPAVVAILPPAGDRNEPTDLLLCCHHYRASRRKLAQLGAFFLDLQGYPLPADSWPHPA